MSTAVAPPAPMLAAPATPRLAVTVNLLRPGQRVLFTDISWDEYEALLEWRDEHRRGVRLTYDRGELEIMVVGGTHERLKKILAMLIEVWLDETGGACVPGGNTTHARADVEQGLEPDECYYIQNWAAVAGVRDIDLAKDPPPDLAVEIEVSRTVLSRLPTFAAFKIPEVWRYDGVRLTVLLLQPDGTYTESPTSSALPALPIGELVRFLALAANVSTDYISVCRQFRAWVRSLPAAPPAAPPA